MFHQLRLENIVIIEGMDIPLAPGMNVITGEAGAGKSLVLESLGWVFGEPLSPKEIIRSGCDHASIELTLSCPAHLQTSPSALQAVLAQAELTETIDLRHLLILRRDIGPKGSRFRLNNQLIPKTVVEQLRPLMMENQAQHAAPMLLKASNHRDILDAFAGQPVTEIKQTVQTCYQQWQETLHWITSLETQSQQREEKIDWLTYQLQELDQAQLTEPDEDQQVEQRLQQLTHLEALQEALDKTSALLSGESQSRWGETETAQPVIDTLAQASRSLSQAGKMDATLAGYEETLEGTIETLRVLSKDLNHHRTLLELQPEELAALQERHHLLQKLKKRYGPTLQEVIEKTQALQHELETLLHQNTSPEALAEKLAEEEQVLKQACEDLNQLRVQAAQSLQQKLEPLLHSLALPDARFEVSIEPEAYSSQGSDQVEFLFSANAGEPLRPLNRVASGGELSRIYLALTALMAGKVSITDVSEAPTLAPEAMASYTIEKTLLFDEIDTGTSGSTAHAMAGLLCQLAIQYGQIILITHQPIVAAAADWHLHLQKSASAETAATRRTATRLAIPQTDEEKVQLIATLAGGTPLALASVNGVAKPNKQPNKQEAVTLYVEELLNHYAMQKQALPQR